MKSRFLSTSLVFEIVWCMGLVETIWSQDVTPTNIWADFFSNRVYLNGERPPVGSVVQAYDPDGILCGEFTVVTPGLYGYLHVYGDEPETPEDEGAVEGDTITFTINGEEAIGIGNKVWLSGNPGGVFKVDLYVGGFPPIIENFPEQISFLEDDSAQINLSEYVYDQDDSQEQLTWTADGISGIDVSIDIDTVIQVATLTAPHSIVGSALVQFSVTDPVGFSDSIQVSVIVINLENDPPVITSSASATATEDELFVYHATAEDPDGPLLIFTFENLSEWLSTVEDSVFGIPTEGITTGIFRIIASDGQLEDTLDVIISVTPVNDPPSSFALIFPVYGDTVESLIVSFLWYQPIDPESDPIEYIFYLSGVEMDTMVTDLSDTTFIFDGNNLFEYESIYTWHIKATDGMDTTLSTTENEFWTPASVSIDAMVELPDEFLLSQNYPNPFNPSTTIRYQLPAHGKVVLKIYNAVGQEIRTLVNENKSAGNYLVIWDGKDELRNDVSSGIYLYQLKADNGRLKTHKALLIR